MRPSLYQYIGADRPTGMRGVRAIAGTLFLGLAVSACSDGMPRGCRETQAPGPTLLTSPGDTFFHAVAPDTFIARFETSRGNFFIQVVRGWAPIGADRFYNLVRAGFYDDTRFFRVVPGFIAQWGINGDSAVNAAWARACIHDDPIRRPNVRPAVSFAFGKPHTRTTQVFFNYGVNWRLDEADFAPFGEVIAGGEVMDSLYAGYGDTPPRGDGPDAVRAMRDGNRYLDAEFPELDRIIRARVVAERGFSSRKK